MPVGWYVVDPPVSGTLAATLKKVQADIVGYSADIGVAASTLQKVQADLSGFVPEFGTADSTLQKVQASLTGFEHTIGAADSTLQKVQAALISEQDQIGIAASTLQKVQASLSGVQVLPKIGTITEDWAAFTTKWNTRAGASLSNSVLNINSSSGDARVGDSVFAYDLTDSAMFTEVPLATTGTWFYAYSSTFGGTSYAGFKKSGSSLLFFETIATVQDSTSVTYNLGVHKWWRLREAAGTLYWETSSDGINWTIRRSKADGQSYAITYPEFWVDNATGVGQFDNFNLPKVKSRPIRVMTRHRLR